MPANPSGRRIEKRTLFAKALDLWNDPKQRSWIVQFLVVIGVLGFFGWVANNTASNLARQNIASGFGFLGETSGFSINQTLIPYSEDSTHGHVLVVGLLNTLRVAILGIFFATILGFTIGVARLSSNWIISRLATVYVEIIRNLPVLLQIFLWFFAFLPLMPNPRDSDPLLGGTLIFSNRGIYMVEPIFAASFWLVFLAGVGAVVGAFLITRRARRKKTLTGEDTPVILINTALIIGAPLLLFGIVSLAAGSPLSFIFPELQGFNFQGGMVIRPSLFALVFALSTYTASFIAEVVRGGILAVSKGQTEAGRALGLRDGQVMRMVILPQAMRVIVPPLANQYLNLTKNSSLAVAIAYPDLVAVFAGTSLSQTGQAVEILSITMLIYLTLSLLTSAFMNWFNAKVALPGR